MIIMHLIEKFVIKCVTCISKCKIFQYMDTEFGHCSLYWLNPTNMHKLRDFTHKTVPGVTDGGSQYRGQFAV